MIDIKNIKQGALYKTSDGLTILWDKQNNAVALEKDTIVMYLKTEFYIDEHKQKIARTFFLLQGRYMYSEVRVLVLGSCLWDNMILLKLRGDMNVK